VGLTEAEAARAARTLARRDPALARLIKQAGPVQFRPPMDDNFAFIARAITFQQLAGKAAMAIHKRFAALFEDGVTAEGAVKIPLESLRGAGLSARKAAYIQDLAARVADGRLPLHDADSLDDEELISRLTEVRGIGRWTAEMFLLFQLRRPDVWPVDDYGVRKGYARTYGLAELPRPRELKAAGERFRPYRSVATWYFYRAVDMVTPSA